MNQTFKTVVKEKQENGTYKVVSEHDSGYSLQNAMSEFFQKISDYKNTIEWASPMLITVKDSFGDVFAKFQIN